MSTPVSSRIASRSVTRFQGVAKSIVSPWRSTFVVPSTRSTTPATSSSANAITPL